MGLRDALVHFDEQENAEDFLKRALQAAKDAGGSGRLRLEVGWAFSLGANKSYASFSLWVERGTGRTESWQRVTPTIMDDTYLGAVKPLLKLMDKERADGS